MSPLPVTFGALPDYQEGHEFLSRLELSATGVHRPTRAGISARRGLGAESIVLSGGYEDDDDRGDTIIYTGQGGRSGASGQQVADQTLSGANMELVRSQAAGHPIRVIRRVEAIGGLFYRYEGLYRISRHWPEAGKSGYQIWRFQLYKVKPADLVATSSSLL